MARGARLTVEGVTAIDLRVLVTVTVCTSRLAVPVMPLSEAVTLVEPEALPVTRPLELIAAIAELPTAQLAVELTFAVEPSLYFAVAVNCCVLPIETLAVAGDTETAVKVFEGGVVEFPMPWHPTPAIRMAREDGAKT